MSSIPGTVVAATLVPTDSNDTFATHDSHYGKGGWREVATIQDRDAIPSQRRRAGMLVYVITDTTEYILESDLVTWTVKPRSDIKDGSYIWPDEATADAYYVANPTLLVEGAERKIALTNTTSKEQKYIGSVWTDQDTGGGGSTIVYTVATFYRVTIDPMIKTFSINRRSTPSGDVRIRAFKTIVERHTSSGDTRVSAVPAPYANNRRRTYGIKEI